MEAVTEQSRCLPRSLPVHAHRIGKLALGITLICLLVEAGRVLVGRNWHCVVPGTLYRCSQPNGEELRGLIRQAGIQTVVNLRGTCDPLPWYQEECRAAHAEGCTLEDVSMSAGRLPSRQEMLRLVEVLENAPTPMLIHCRRGADRTGLACAIYLLLQHGAGREQAMHQLGLRYGHAPVGRTTHLDLFLSYYLDYLDNSSQRHSPSLFRDWLSHHYEPAQCAAQLEILSSTPLKAKREDYFPIRVRATNKSQHPWRFRPGKKAGDHLWLCVYDAAGNGVALERGGLCDLSIAPGESAELVVHIPPLHMPGRYRLLVDMCDEQHCSFYQVGSAPIETEILVE